MSLVRFELGFYIPGDDIVHIHHRVNVRSYMKWATSIPVIVLSYLFSESVACGRA
jgi:hypothetical protein